MKKVLAAGLLAIGLIAISQTQASAWTNSRFGIGLNWERQTGGNGFGWGLYHNGQPPGPEAMPSFYHGQSNFPSYGMPSSHSDMPIAAPTYAQPSATYAVPYQFATYPRPVYYYSWPYYYGR